MALSNEVWGSSKFNAPYNIDINNIVWLFFLAHADVTSESNYSSPVVAVIVCIVVLAILLVAMAVYFALHIRRKKPIIQ